MQLVCGKRVSAGGSATPTRSVLAIKRGTANMERSGTRKIRSNDDNNRGKPMNVNAAQNSNSNLLGEKGTIGKTAPKFALGLRNNVRRTPSDSAMLTVQDTGAIQKKESINREWPEPNEAARLATSLSINGRLYSEHFDPVVLIAARSSQRETAALITRSRCCGEARTISRISSRRASVAISANTYRQPKNFKNQ